MKDDKIMWWLDVFSRPDSSFRLVRSEEDIWEWTPQTKDEQKAFGCLIAIENREALKTWYGRFPVLNPNADSFRRILERAISEKLRLSNDNSDKESAFQ